MTAPDWWRLSYRGYGGSDGKPTEDGLIADARAAYDFARATYPDAKLVLWGESLGTGVAVALAAEKDVAAVILEAPFTSTADVAFSAYPFVPVRLLMKDQFRSDERIGKVKAPVLVMHGARDRIVPFRSGRAALRRRQRAQAIRALRRWRPRGSRPLRSSRRRAQLHRAASALDFLGRAASVHGSTSSGKLNPAIAVTTIARCGHGPSASMNGGTVSGGAGSPR